MTTDDGHVLVVDEQTEDAFTAPGSEMERLFYGCSVTICLPDGRSREQSVGTGTMMRADTPRKYALDAGFGDAEVLPIEHPQFRVYRLKPKRPPERATEQERQR